MLYFSFIITPKSQQRPEIWYKSELRKTKIIKSNYQPHSSIYLLLFLCRHLAILASQYLALHLYFPPKQTKAKTLVTALTSRQSPATWPFSAHQSVCSDANSSSSVWGDFKIIRVREKIKRKWYTRSKFKIIWTELASVSKECSHLPGEVGTLRDGPFTQARSLSAGPILVFHCPTLAQWRMNTPHFWAVILTLSGQPVTMSCLVLMRIRWLPFRESENTVVESHLHTLGGWDT